MYMYSLSPLEHTHTQCIFVQHCYKQNLQNLQYFVCVWGGGGERRCIKKESKKTLIVRYVTCKTSE